MLSAWAEREDAARKDLEVKAGFEATLRALRANIGKVSVGYCKTCVLRGSLVRYNQTPNGNVADGDIIDRPRTRLSAFPGVLSLCHTI